jgi:hypothetical protein
MDLKPTSGGDEDDADESFDMKTYDITYNEELAGSSSDDDSAKKPSESADSGAVGAGGIADHLGKAQKKTMDMCRTPPAPRPLLLTPCLLLAAAGPRSCSSCAPVPLTTSQPPLRSSRISSRLLRKPPPPPLLPMISMLATIRPRRKRLVPLPYYYCTSTRYPTKHAVMDCDAGSQGWKEGRQADAATG